MTCQEFIEFLMDYAEGVLPADQRARFDEHLRLCPDCVHYLASYRTTTALGKAALTADERALPTEVPPALIQAILAARKR